MVKCFALLFSLKFERFVTTMLGGSCHRLVVTFSMALGIVHVVLSTHLLAVVLSVDYNQSERNCMTFQNLIFILVKLIFHCFSTLLLTLLNLFPIVLEYLYTFSCFIRLKPIPYKWEHFSHQLRQTII
jgi:hypothetical protein